jgi:hypothetical protein
MYFGTKNYLKSNHNYTAKHTRIKPSQVDKLANLLQIDFHRNNFIIYKP